MSIPGIAVIGLGFMGRTHIQTLRRMGLEVRGIAGINEEEAHKVASQYNIKKWYRDFFEAIEDPDIEVIHLCTPNNLHYEQAKAALSVGKHILCEKPLAMTIHQSKELLSLAKQKGLITAVNYNIRFYPICQEAHYRVLDGDLGNPYLISGGYLQDWLFLKTDWNWRLDPEQGGETRVIADIGTHWMDLVAYITGLKVSSVMADFSIVHKTRLQPRGEIETFKGKLQRNNSADEKEIKTEDVAVILYKFENGALGNLSLSQVSAGRKNFLWFEICGSKTAYHWNQENPNELWIGYREQPNQILVKDPSLFHDSTRKITGFPGGHAEGYPDTFMQTFHQFYDTISGDLQKIGDFATFEDGHYEMLLCEAIKRSAIERRWIGLDEVVV